MIVLVTQVRIVVICGVNIGGWCGRIFSKCRVSAGIDGGYLGVFILPLRQYSLICVLLCMYHFIHFNSILKSRDITLPKKVCIVKAMVFPVGMYGCESWTIQNWAPKNWCFWTVVLEKTLESPLDCKVIQPVHSEGDQSWVFIGSTDAEAETPVLWPPHAKSWLIGKDPDAEKDWGQEKKGAT